MDSVEWDIHELGCAVLIRVNGFCWRTWQAFEFTQTAGKDGPETVLETDWFKLMQLSHSRLGVDIT